MAPKRKGKKEETATKRAKVERPSIKELYDTCVTEADENIRRKNLFEAEEAGILTEVLWPEMCSMKSKKGQDWLRACYLLANILSWRNREGHVVGTLDFVEDTKTWDLCLDTLCNDEHTDLGYLTIVSHLLTITHAAGQAKKELSESIRPHVDTISMWHWMPEIRRELEIRKDPDLDLGKKPKHRPFIVKIVENIIRLLESNTFRKDRKDGASDTEEDEEILKSHSFLHRSLELLIDLLSMIESRSSLTIYLDSIHFSIRCQMAIGDSKWSRADPLMFTTQQLLDRLRTLLDLHILGSKVLDSVETVSLYHRRGVVLQKICNRYFLDRLPDIIYAGVGILCNGSDFVRQSLGVLKDEELSNLLHKMRLVDKNASNLEHYNRDFLVKVLEEYLTIPEDPLETLRKYPLYPTERVLWDFSRIPPSHSALLPISNVLSLPKLNNRFLSFTDYLSRTFELTRLESAYEIRSDIVDSIKRLRPLARESIELDDDREVTKLKTEFSGWSRMALEMSSKLQIKKVDKPYIGEKHPRQVVAEFEVDLAPCGDSIRREWNSLRQFDNLFLLCVDASKMSDKEAPLLRDYHLSQGNHMQWSSDGERRVPDVDDRTFPSRFGIMLVRGCMIMKVSDEEGNSLDTTDPASLRGTKRVFRVLLDSSQYIQDRDSDLGTDLYRSLNLVIRRHGRENNFKAVLETIKGLMGGRGSIEKVLPSWMQNMILGKGEPNVAYYSSASMQAFAEATVGVPDKTSWLDFVDTFLDDDHLRSSFPQSKVKVEATTESEEIPCYRIRFENDDETRVIAQRYDGARRIEYNIRFTPVQVEAIRAGLSPGLSCVVGPPGTGKTDVAVQIIASLYHSFPTQRTVIITHSNAALNDIFQKVMSRGDVDQRYMIRLGSGERDLDNESMYDFTKAGRVAYSLSRRGELLEEVQKLSESLSISTGKERGADGSSAYTCETAEYFCEHHVKPRLRLYESQDTTKFPFCNYFGLNEANRTEAKALTKRLFEIFDELREYRPLELLRTQKQRTDYLLMKQARVVAMTCTHAAIARSQLLDLDFEYDNLVIEEAGQMTDIESFIPLLLQQGKAKEGGNVHSRLKRVSMFGDHHQLPPVIKNMSLARYTNMDQSLFARFIRSGVPFIQLDKQGRARSELADLYRWRYSDLGDLDRVSENESFQLANTGFAHTFQMINVEDFEGKGESTPTPFFYQNMGEAEYVVAMFQYMVLIGYPPERISILTTYNGQKSLIDDILRRRCGEGTPLRGIHPRVVSTVDQYQGQQNDIVLLSLVRTASVGHLRDIRRLVVAVSRARLGLYVFCRSELFLKCHELKNTFNQLSSRPTKLQLVVGETYPTERRVEDEIDSESLFEVDGVDHLGSIVYEMQNDAMAED